MPDIDDPFAVIAASYRLHAEAVLRLQATQDAVLGLHRLGLRVQALTVSLLGLSLLGTGWLVWYHLLP